MHTSLSENWQKDLVKRLIIFKEVPMGVVTVGQMDYLIGFRYRTEHGASGQIDEVLEKAVIRHKDGASCLLFRTRTGERILRLIRETDQDVSAPADGWQEDGWHLLYPEENPDSASAFVLGIFYELQSFRANFRVRLSLDEDLHGAAAFAASFLGIELSVLDRNLVNRSMTPWNRIQDQTREKDSASMSLAAISDLYENDPLFDETYHTTGLCVYQVTSDEHFTRYYYNIRYQGEYLARVLILLPMRPWSEAILPLLEEICALIEENCAASYRKEIMNRAEINLSKGLHRILDDPSADRGEIQAQLIARGWMVNDRYEIFYLLPIVKDLSKQTLVFYCLQMMDVFPACSSYASANSITVIHNLTAENHPGFRGKLSAFLRDHLLKAGKSNDFCGFFSAGRHLYQALYALDKGQEIRPTHWVFSFQDFLFEYIIERCTGQFGADELMPESLVPLREYDEKHPDAGLMQTLYQYIASHFNASAAADALYIHRTTFFYRWNRILDLTSPGLDDPRKLIEIMMYFAGKNYFGNTSGSPSETEEQKDLIISDNSV